MQTYWELTQQRINQSSRPVEIDEYHIGAKIRGANGRRPHPAGSYLKLRAEQLDTHSYFQFRTKLKRCYYQY